MNLFRKLQDIPGRLRGGAATIGNFDGVHIGHARIIQRLRQYAKSTGGAAVVFTFDPHPVRLLRPEQSPPPLTWTNRKAELLSELGVDAVVAYPTHVEFLAWTYRQFFDEIIVRALGAKAIVEGPNFYFGHNREGNVDVLNALCRQHNIQCDIVAPMEEDGDFISSSRIRDRIRCGDVGTARRWLTHPYRIRGLVTHGVSRGSQLGFPTANLDGIDTMIPAEGVYSGRAHVLGQSHLCAVHIGSNPTFRELAQKVEVHILSFDESIYGQTIEVDFIERLRDIRQFASVDELRQQLDQDITRVRLGDLS